MLTCERYGYKQDPDLKSKSPRVLNKEWWFASITKSRKKKRGKKSGKFLRLKILRILKNYCLMTKNFLSVPEEMTNLSFGKRSTFPFWIHVSDEVLRWVSYSLYPCKNYKLSIDQNTKIKSLHTNADWVKKSMYILKNHKSWHTDRELSVILLQILLNFRKL